MFSGSIAERAEACPASCVLPQVYDQSTAGEEGTWKHKFLETEDIDVLPENLRPWGEAVDLERLPWKDGRDDRALGKKEDAYAFNFVDGTVRHLGVGINRCYEVTSDEIPLTIDVWWIDRDGWLHIADHKTGAEPVYAKDNLQLGLGARCVEKYTDHLGPVMVHILQWDELGRYRMNSNRLEQWDLFAIEERVAKIAHNVLSVQQAFQKGVIPNVRTGGHCRYCPATAHCPATGKLIKQTLSIDEVGMDAAIAAFTPREVANAHVALKRMEAICQQLKRGLSARIAVDPEAEYVADDGTIVYQVQAARRSVEVRKALPILREYIDNPERLVKDSITLSDIKRAAPQKYDAIIDALETAGVVKTVDTTSIHSRRMKKQVEP